MQPIYIKKEAFRRGDIFENFEIFLFLGCARDPCISCLADKGEGFKSSGDPQNSSNDNYKSDRSFPWFIWDTIQKTF